MNYRAIYDRLIERAKTRRLIGYGENHHIVPRCISGGDEVAIIVRLTPEEHYLAHQMLVRLFPGNGKLLWAAIAMTEGGRSKMRAGNKLYGWLRRRFSDEQRGRQHSAETKSKIGDKSRARNAGVNHPMFGRHHSNETRAKISIAKAGRVCRKYGPVSDHARAKQSEARKLYHENNPNPFAGRKHSEEAKAKMRATKALRKMS